MMVTEGEGRRRNLKGRLSCFNLEQVTRRLESNRKHFSFYLFFSFLNDSVAVNLFSPFFLRIFFFLFFIIAQLLTLRYERINETGVYT